MHAGRWPRCSLWCLFTTMPVYCCLLQCMFTTYDACMCTIDYEQETHTYRDRRAVVGAINHREIIRPRRFSQSPQRLRDKRTQTHIHSRCINLRALAWLGSGGFARSLREKYFAYIIIIIIVMFVGNKSTLTLKYRLGIYTSFI